MLLLTLLLHTALAEVDCDALANREAAPGIPCWSSVFKPSGSCAKCCRDNEPVQECWFDDIGLTKANCCPPAAEEDTDSGQDMDSASSHGDPIIHTFKGECYDLNKDGLYLASSHPHWNHEIKVAVYNNFIREFQITTKDDQILFSVNNLNEVTGSWAYGLKHIYRMCTPFSWKECEFSFNEYRFDAQIFMYGVQILFHDYLDPALQKGQRGVHLDIYPRLYEKHQQTFNAEDWDGIYFDNPLPQELAYCPGNSPRRS